MLGTSKILAVVACGLVLCAGATCSAGVLNGHASAYGGWTGTVSFDDLAGLKGDLDFAVFTASAFNANFGGLGYVPGDQLVYTYQLTNTGQDAISAEIVGVSNPANTIGSFDIGDVMPSAAVFSGGNALWQFNPGIPTNITSWGLAFSSPNIPMAGAGLTINGGSSVLETGVPTPSAVPIPEPTSLLLWSLCSGAILLLCRRLG